MDMGHCCFSHKSFVVPDAVGVIIRESVDPVIEEENGVDVAGVTAHCVTDFSIFMVLFLLVDSNGSC